MKAEELRINSTYLSVKWKQPVRLELSDLRELYIRCEGAALDSEIIGWMFEPIELTEEWLIKFGFNKNLNGEITLEIGSYTNADLWFNKNSGQLRLVASDGKYLTHDNLKYVHQLQNLYFALTNKELTIKL